MKPILLILLFFVAANVDAQSNKKDTITFCYIKYPVPEGCISEPNSSVKCDGWKLSWIYLSAEMLQTVPDQLVSQMAGQLKKFKKEAITCYLLFNPAKGYKLSFKSEDGTAYQLIAYGIANEQPVIVQLSLTKEPKSNEDIPEFARQIIRLTR